MDWNISIYWLYLEGKKISKTKQYNMRIELNIRGNDTLIPFTHQPWLVGTIHKWLGENEWHGHTSPFSFSRLSGGRVDKEKKGLIIGERAKLTISAHLPDFLSKLIEGIRKDPSMFKDLVVQEIVLIEDPDLSNRELFFPLSPIFLKERQPDGTYSHILFGDKQANALLTDNIRTKLQAAGIEDKEATAEFVTQEQNVQVMLVEYKGIKNRVNWCPVRIQAKPESKLFLWNVGLGHSTGIGFGCIK